MKITSPAGSALLAAFAAVLTACGGGSGTSAVPPQAAHPWAVSIDATNHSAVCAIVSFYERENGGSWNGPFSPDSSPHLQPGDTDGTEFTYRVQTLNAAFGVQAGFFKTKSCSGPQTIVRVDSATLGTSASVHATLAGSPGSYTITYRVKNEP